MSFHAWITQGALSLALAVSGFTLHTAAHAAPPQAPAGSQSWLGVGIIDLTPDRADEMNLAELHGVEIAQVADGGPAQDAGLQRGDIITRFRGQMVLDAEHLAQLVHQTPGGRTVILEVWRDGRKRDVEVVVEPRSPVTALDLAQQFKRQARGVGFDFPRSVTVIRNRSIGMEMEAIEDQFARFFGVAQGVLVRSVEAGSPASESGLLAGDVIVSVDASAVQDPADVRRELHDSPATVEVGIVRNRRSSKITLTKEESVSGVWPLADHN